MFELETKVEAVYIEFTKKTPFVASMCTVVDL